MQDKPSNLLKHLSWRTHYGTVMLDNFPKWINIFIHPLLLSVRHRQTRASLKGPNGGISRASLGFEPVTFRSLSHTSPPKEQLQSWWVQAASYSSAFIDWESHTCQNKSPEESMSSWGINLKSPKRNIARMCEKNVIRDAVSCQIPGGKKV